MKAGDVMPILLLLLFSSALVGGIVFVVIVVRLAERRSVYDPDLPSPVLPPTVQNPGVSFLRRPVCWLVVRSTNLLAVQSALGLRNAKPCTWREGLTGDENLFISPPVAGWIVVSGTGLPDPSEDVDACFRFVRALSLKLGQVQLFCASRIVHHHAWVRADGGRVQRAYAWAGQTIWDQGNQTLAEQELNLKCFHYAEPAGRGVSPMPDCVASNVDKVPLLAARWSLDPARIDNRFLEQEQGVTGEMSCRY